MEYGEGIVQTTNSKAERSGSSVKCCKTPFMRDIPS